MAELKQQILASIDADPEDYDSREVLWMERENLRAQLQLTAIMERFEPAAVQA